MLTETSKFAELFKGRTDAYGLGKGLIVREHPYPAVQYAEHLEGLGSGIGIFPLLDDGTCHFAAIDLDEADFVFATALQGYLPGKTWIERSRSGNAHVWAFFRRPVAAWVARGILRFALESHGRPEVEVFPKQDQLRPGMLGNYINLPYHGHRRPILLSRDPTDECSRETFLQVALEQRTDPEDWHRRALALGLRPPEQRISSAEFGEQTFLHPCATHILANREINPLREGHRNVVMFHVACQLLNYEGFDEEEVAELLLELGGTAEPPMPRAQVLSIMDNARRGEYTFTGCDDPLMAPYVRDDCPIAHG